MDAGEEKAHEKLMRLPSVWAFVYIQFMSKSIKGVVRNSFFQTAGAFINSVINFVVTLGYARFLGPETYGSLVTSQAQVLVWTAIVDLGLSNSLISALTAAEGERSKKTEADSGQKFLGRDFLFRVLFLRLVGAVLGTAITFALAWFHSSESMPRFWQEVAFTPFLFALALSQTGIAYSAYMNKQGLSVIAMILGMVVTSSITLSLAWRGVGVGWLLLSQSWAGFLSAGIIFSYFWIKLRGTAGEAPMRFQQRISLSTSQWRKGTEIWRALATDAWPYALSFAVMVLWQRLDQLAASNILGLAAGGQYALAVRLVSVPILVATSVSVAIFPDLQRVGRDAPDKVRVILGVVNKAVFRYGIPIAAIMVLGIALVIVSLVPKFRPAVWLLPHFLPGIWAFWMQSFVLNSLFGLRAYRECAEVHLFAIVIYVFALFSLPHLFGLAGVAWAFNIFCFLMYWLGFRAAKRVGVFHPEFLLYQPFTQEERQLIERSGLFFL